MSDAKMRIAVSKQHVFDARSENRPGRTDSANPTGCGHIRPAMSASVLLRGLLVIGLLLPIAILAQQTEPPDSPTQTATQQEERSQNGNDTQEEEEVEETEEIEDPSLVEDIIPSEMISEDLAVDFPIDI